MLWYLSLEKGAVPMPATTIGERVRALRERQGLSQYALAHRLGISTTAIQLLEANATTNPRADRVVALARYFDISADYLLGLSAQEHCRC